MKDPAEIIRKKKKGFKVARPGTKPQPAAEHDFPVVAKPLSLEDLKAKYLPKDMLHGTAPADDAHETDDDLESVEVVPDTETGDDPDGPGRKTVIISRSSEEIVGEQG
jgi:hypothetical protein